MVVMANTGKQEQHVEVEDQRITISVCLPESVDRRLKERAKKEARSKSNLGAVLIEEGLAAREGAGT